MAYRHLLLVQLGSGFVGESQRETCVQCTVHAEEKTQLKGLAAEESLEHDLSLFFH